jgi:outer membrane receptor protein involved in Fe transport
LTGCSAQDRAVPSPTIIQFAENNKMTAGHFRAKHIVVNPLALSLALALAAPAVVAQTAPATTEQGPKTLDVITVTAEKREEDIQKVPISISTIPAEELDVLRLSGDDIRSLSARVPSLLIESSFGRTFPRFYIRGLGNTDFDLNASQPVSLVYDDVVLENPILKGFPIFDLDQVEVFRGPQGTLFGRNTPPASSSSIRGNRPRIPKATSTSATAVTTRRTSREQSAAH